MIECSSYQIDLAPSLDPRVGILINLSPDHLDRHGTMENYAAVKERLVAACRRRHRGDRRRRRLVRARSADRVAAAGKTVVRDLGRASAAPTAIYAEAAEIVSMPRASRRAGRSRRSPASARCAARTTRRTRRCAAAPALALGLDAAAIQRGLRSFPGLAHRMEQVGRKGRVLFVNDSKATNADSAAQALACFTDIFWIAGGKPKTGGITSLAAFFPRIRKAYLIGEAADDFARTLDGKVPYEMAGTLDRAVEAAARDAAASGAEGAGGAAVAGLRLVRPVSAISRCAATRSATWCWRCRARAVTRSPAVMRRKQCRKPLGNHA